ncbi:hypothetical protein [Methylorubrum sp. SL192]|uniref:hypothetical protein n=1 Tax=Methylorubrum sp. SL192 TaxID=2995167 RepID=UPI002273F307|nr:hypothetical protein [Methylorubrum sp. SL192]MCY1643161.1 hypothetical protein [Methylorubrum sp. SL192]
MTPQEIKAKVQGAYVKALENRFMQRHRSSGIYDLFRAVKLYGRDAGADFAETNLGRIVNEAAEMAGCKEASLEMLVHGWGKAALDGMAQALRDLTSLKVEVSRTTVRLVWAEANPGLV